MISPNTPVREVTVAQEKKLAIHSSHLIFHSSHAWVTCALFISPADSPTGEGICELLFVSETHQSTKEKRKHPERQIKEKGPGMCDYWR